MKLFKNIMSRKPDPEEITALDAEALEERSRAAVADDSGRRNRSLPEDDDLQLDAPAQDPAPDPAEDSGWGASAWEDDDEDWDDEDWGDDWDDDVTEGNVDPKAALVDGIRDAARDIQNESRRDEVRNWSEDEEVGRRSASRSKLGADVEDAEDRILSRTNSEMTNIMSSRRRSAMAHLKKAAQATKADRVLSHVVGRDAAGDPDEQSPYRDDLAKVVKPRATSRPVSRPVSRSPKVQAAWENAPADEDAAMMAEASEDPRGEIDRSIFEEERQQHLPADLTEDEFISDDILVSRDNHASDKADETWDDDDDDDEDRPRGPASWSKPIFEDDSDDSDEAAAVALATRRASRVRSSLADLTEDDDEPATGTDDAAEDDLAPVAWGLGGQRDEDDEDDDFEEVDLTDDSDDWSAPSLDAVQDRPAEPTRSIDLDAVRSGVSEMTTPEPGSTPTANTTAGAKQADETPEAIVQVPTPAIGRAGRSAGRVKTRLLGFQATEPEPDVFDKAGSAEASGRSQFPVGWIVVVEGPGRGQAFTLMGGVMQIGRGQGQGVQLDFGDTAISRENHAAVAFDDETGKFYLGHGGKSNLVRLNGSPVLTTEELSNRDRIRIGETTLMFVGLCNEEFIWTPGEGSDDGA